MLPDWLQAGLWGLLSGGALLIGAAIGYFVAVPKRVIAGIMAFGSGVLFSALSFELMDEAHRIGGFDATAIDFLGGATVYTAVNYYISHRGANIESGRVINNRQKAHRAVVGRPLRWVRFVFDEAHEFAGLITVVGFLLAFVLSKLEG